MFYRIRTLIKSLGVDGWPVAGIVLGMLLLTSHGKIPTVVSAAASTPANLAGVDAFALPERFPGHRLALPESAALSTDAPLGIWRSPLAQSMTITYTRMVYLPVTHKYWPPLASAPYLYEIDYDQLDDSFEIAWRASESSYQPVTYTVQESPHWELDDENFAKVEYTSVLTSYAFSEKPIGYYYYRVRANNVWGSSPWSNVRMVKLVTRMDDFDHPVTGWTTRRTSSPDLGLITATYEDGQLITHVQDRFDFGIFSPMLEAPELPYRIIMRTQIIHKANETSYGIVFGGNVGDFCQIDRSTAGYHEGCFYHYYRLNVIWGGYLKYGVKRIDYHEGDKGSARGKELANIHSLPSYLVSADGWNTWEVKVYEDGFALYVNGKLLETFDDITYIDDPMYGIFSSTAEYNSAGFRHAHFFVEPLPLDEPQSLVELEASRTDSGLMHLNQVNSLSLVR